MAGMSRSAAMLPEELLVEILVRVPYRSLCRFRCVSPSWRALCSDPGLLKRSPKTLSGFFGYTISVSCCSWIYYRDTRFLNFPGVSSGRRPLVDPSLALLRAGGYTDGFLVADCCRGLLLVCEGSTSTSGSPSFPSDRDYLVCNPATEKWTVFPRMSELHPRNILRLCVDPADPSRFTVLVFVQDYDEDTCVPMIIGVEIYSSETKTWLDSEQTGWGKRTSVRDYQNTASVFLNGTLHLTTYDSHVVTVDMDGKAWSKFQSPYRGDGCIGQSQGRLHAMQIQPSHYNDNGFLLSVWVLEDYARGFWSLKHTANITELLGVPPKLDCTLITIHPDSDLIFFVDELKKRMMSYDMDSQEVQVVYNEGEYYGGPYLPYTPCFADWLHPIQRKEMVPSSGRKRTCQEGTKSG